MRVVAIGTETAWSVEHPKLTGLFNFDTPGKVKREARTQVADDEPMYAIYHDPRKRNGQLVELTWTQYCETGFTDAWFEVGPRRNKQKIRCLINLVNNDCLVDPKNDDKWVPLPLSEIDFGPEDIVEGLHFINPVTLQCDNVTIQDAISKSFYNLLCTSQGFTQVAF